MTISCPVAPYDTVMPVKIVSANADIITKSPTR